MAFATGGKPPAGRRQNESLVKGNPVSIQALRHLA
jgi:hypothetical protein